MNNSAIGGTWEELEREIFTPEEIAASNLRVALMCVKIKQYRQRRVSVRRSSEG